MIRGGYMNTIVNFKTILRSQLSESYLYGRCPEGIGRHKVKISFCPSVLLSFCHVTFTRPLIGQKRECYIVEEVIEVDELDKCNISAALGKAELAELCHTRTYIKSNIYQIMNQILN